MTGSHGLREAPGQAPLGRISHHYAAERLDATDHNRQPHLDDVRDRARVLRVPVVITVTYRPAGRRRLWLSVVASCPTCKQPHAHRGTEQAPATGVRRAGCRGAYWLAVTG